MPPHFHPTDERVEVKQGALLVGMGDRLDVRKTLALAVGDTAVAPAGIHHYSVAKGATVVAVTFIGPYTITLLACLPSPAAGLLSPRLLAALLRSAGIVGGEQMRDLGA
jgi:hypothetical protein